ncbi:hypothetical protein [Sphingomonas sp. URHD0057]|uniref:hypothetical protein n=1 Tax=Sphingomonas sp. URHD0057 TaxID=1380389 RepID=UPI000490C12F|nr:hypothetical protein [Sphingomonas sp. URHD0057]
MTLGYGTTGLSVGQRLFGLMDWYRDHTLAEHEAVQARNLAPLPGDMASFLSAAFTATRPQHPETGAARYG